MHILKARSLFICVAIIEVFCVFGLSALPARAETRVKGVILEDAAWTATDSPYLLEDDVTVPDMVTLTVGPGVSIGLAPDVNVDDLGYAPSLYVTGGRLSVQGTGRSRVSVTGIGGAFVAGGSTMNGSADIADADFTGGAKLSFNQSRGTIASSTIIGANTGLYLHDSAVSVWGSRIKDDQTGIYVQPHRVFMVDAAQPQDPFSHFGTGGIGNALADVPDISASSSLAIHGSSIVGNTGRAISNNASFTVDAAENWWGSSGGPALSGANAIQGPVNYQPWLPAEPALDAGADRPCCSSILFLPGLEGTRLYRTMYSQVGGWFGHGTTTSQLWEPTGNINIPKLYLDASGSSTDTTIYAGGPIDKALGISDVYGGFMSFLDGLVRKGTVSEWRAFGYDWRKPVAEVVAGSEKRATTTESLVQTVADLAARSRTGKVTLIAHSNGGLVAKDLVKTLADSGRSGLIDSVISVAVPYLGTPAAIPSMLDGYGESIGYGILARAADMRTLGANMPSAYGLLPSRAFFDSVADIFKPTIAYASTTAASFDAQMAFIADPAHARPAATPSSSDLATPIRGNSLLMAAADAIHGLIDPFSWPSTIARWAIVGWDSPTPKSTVYSSDGYSVDKTAAGDGTVISPSAAYNAGQAVSVDLAVQSTLDGRDISHATILESSTTQAAIGSIVSNPAAQNRTVLDQVSKLPGVTIGELDWAHVDDSIKELQITTHSPVALNVYDSHGRHTGEIPMPAQLVGKVDDGFYTFYESNIPGSSFSQPGGSADQPDESVLVPDNGEKYTVVLNGTAAGSFTLDLDRIKAGSTVESAAWNDMPVSAVAVATTTIASGPLVTSTGASVSLASSTALLQLDIDGDGIADATSSVNTTQDPDTVLRLLEKASDTLDRHGSRGKGLMSRLEHARGVWQSWQKKGAASSHHLDFEGVGGRIGHLRLKGMSDSDRSRALDDIGAFVKQFE